MSHTIVMPEGRYEATPNLVIFGVRFTSRQATVPVLSAVQAELFALLGFTIDGAVPPNPPSASFSPKLGTDGNYHVDDFALQKTTDVGYDVYLIAGQSNASGRGMAYDAANFDPQSGRVQQYAAAGPLAGVVAQAQEPLGFPDYPLTIGMGPALVFARWMQHATPENRRILLVPAAYGGTGFTTTFPLCWDPAQAGSLYTRAIAQANAAMAAAGPRARFAGILWVQGEYDTAMTQAAYAAKLDALIAGFRAGITGASTNTPFVIGRITPGFVAANSGAPKIEAAHIDTPARTAFSAVSPGPSGYDDALHYTAAGQRIAGRNLFEAFIAAKAATAVQPLAVPTAVTGLDATVSTTGLTLAWTPQGRTASYKVERSTDGGSTWSTLAATVYGNTYAVTSGLAAGAARYRVTGQNAAGLGAPATVTVTLATPGQVTGLTSPSQGSTTVSLSWNALTVGSQAVAYLVEYSTDGGSTWLTSGTVTTTTATVSGLTAATSYKFRATAKSGGVSGTASSTVTQATIGAVNVSDAFTRADSATVLGGSFTALSGTWGIRSNTAYLAVAPGSGFAIAAWALGASDGTASVDVVGSSIDTGAAGLMVRATDANNYFGFRFGGGQVQPYKVVGGNTTALATMTAAHSSSGTATISVQMSGSTFTVKVNGTTVGTFTDTFNQSASSHGLWATTVNANSSIDNFALAS